jgi:hypothetical protein
MGSERVVSADEKNDWETMARATKDWEESRMSMRF